VNQFEQVAFSLVATGASVYALAQIGLAIRASRWPSVEGEIAQTRLVHRLDADGYSTDYPYVAYRYRVDGRAYRNDRVRYGPSVAPSSILPGVDPAPKNSGEDSLARTYPDGKPVRVYYNPRDPADSVLFLAPDWTVWVILTAGIVFLYAGLHSSLGAR
jgi:hypothetical protein